MSNVRADRGSLGPGESDLVSHTGGGEKLAFVTFVFATKRPLGPGPIVGARVCWAAEHTLRRALPRPQELAAEGRCANDSMCPHVSCPCARLLRSPARSEVRNVKKQAVISSVGFRFSGLEVVAEMETPPLSLVVYQVYVVCFPI